MKRFEDMTWKEHKFDYMQFMYGDKLAEYEHCKDDRRVYFNTYNMIIEALKELPDEPSAYVCCAMNHYIDEDLKRLDRIREVFDKRAKEDK